jgi:FixJ family two-component response regulator
MTALVSSHPSVSPGYIAVVDDDVSVRRAYARLIGTHSFCVQTYGSGAEFLDTLSTSVPACLIVDLQMDDMTGLELLHRLTTMGLRIPAIVVTARDEPGVQHRCKLWGAVAFLVKPVMGDLLLSAIKDAIEYTVLPQCSKGVKS